MFAIKKTTRGTLPRIPFEEMARSVLGMSYELSLVVCGDDLAQRMNVQYRKKSYKPNVLSFPLSKSEGEIFLNVRCAAREARRYQVPVRDRVALLYVHGLYHLKGLKHGTAMERAEKRTLARFSFTVQ